MVSCPPFTLSIIITTRSFIDFYLRFCFESSTLYCSRSFIALSDYMFLLSLILNDFLFLSKYIRFPSIINVPLICSGNVWRIFSQKFCIISLFVLLKHLYTSYPHCKVLLFHFLAFHMDQYH